MATVVDNCLEHIQIVRTKINECFKRARELLALRESNLLSELDNIHRNYEIESRSHQEELKGLQISKQTLISNLRDNDTLDESLTAINRKIEHILKLSSEKYTIQFQWNTEFERGIKQAGEIISYTTIPPTNNKNNSDDSEKGDQIKRVRALFDYQADDDDELAFAADDIIINVEEVSKEWWFGEINGQKGLFLANQLKYTD